MATKKQDFLVKSTNIRVQINSEFDNLIKRVNTRRNELLSKLDHVVSRYQRLVRESKQAFRQLEQLQLQSKKILNIDTVKGVQDKVRTVLENEAAEMKKVISDLNLSFEWTDDFEEMIPELGTLILGTLFSNINEFISDKPPLLDMDYASSVPLISLTNGRYMVTCLCVDQNTSYIYASSGSSVNVFNEFGHLLFNFGGHYPIVTPSGIAIFEDKIYISCSSRQSIVKYRLCGEQTPKLIKTPDISKTELNNPTLMSIDESDGHVYVCDTGNRRVVRYNKFLNYHSEIRGKDKFTPLNVKITQTRIILFVRPTAEVVTHPIRLYSKEKYQFLKSLFVEPHGRCFDIDTSGNLLVSLGSFIYIYDGDGNLVHKLTCEILQYGIRHFTINPHLVVSTLNNMLCAIWL